MSNTENPTSQASTVASLRHYYEDLELQGEKWVLGFGPISWNIPPKKTSLKIQKPLQKNIPQPPPPHVQPLPTKPMLSSPPLIEPSPAPPSLSPPLKSPLPKTTSPKDFRKISAPSTKQSDLVFVRLSPSLDELRQDQPYSDESGALLNKILGSMKPHMKQNPTTVFKTYFCRCYRDHFDRDDEEDTWRKEFYQEMALVKPKVVVCWSELLSQWLTGIQKPMEELRRSFYKDKMGFTLVTSWDPFFISKQKAIKRLVWEDMKRLGQLL